MPKFERGGDLYGSRTLTERELFITELIAQGLTNRQAALRLQTTPYMVANALKDIFDKLGLWNRVELALWWEARQEEK